MSTGNEAATTAAGSGWFGHPRQLKRLFTTEMWERFGFYMVQTILILYMSKGLLYSDKKSYLLYGAFSSLLYLTSAERASILNARLPKATAKVMLRTKVARNLLAALAQVFEH